MKLSNLIAVRKINRLKSCKYFKDALGHLSFCSDNSAGEWIQTSWENVMKNHNTVLSDLKTFLISPLFVGFLQCVLFKLACFQVAEGFLMNAETLKSK